MIGPRLPNKPPVSLRGGPAGLQSSQHRSRSAEMTEEGRQRVTSIAPGLLGIVNGTGYAGVCLKEMGSRPLTQSVKKSKRAAPSQAGSLPVTPNQEGGGNGRPYST